jgi:hypothetical protein
MGRSQMLFASKAFACGTLVDELRLTLVVVPKASPIRASSHQVSDATAANTPRSRNVNRSQYDKISR